MSNHLLTIVFINTWLELDDLTSVFINTCLELDDVITDAIT